MQSRYHAIMKNRTWSLWDLHVGKNANSPKWVFKLKCKPNGTIDGYKFGLVAKGYDIGGQGKLTDQLQKCSKC